MKRLKMQSTRSYVYVEFENVKSRLLQKAHNPVRTCKQIVPLHRRIVPSMEIHANSRLNLAWCRRCTNANCTSTRSNGYVDFANVNHRLVQKAHNPVRGCKQILPQTSVQTSVQRAHQLRRACQCIRHRQRSIVPTIEIQANSRIKSRPEQTLH